MNKYQPTFDLFEWDSPAKPQEQEQEQKRPADAHIFIAFLKQVAPQLVNDHPIHKTKNGYVTNNSPWSAFGQFEIDLKNAVIIHRQKVARLIGFRYEYEIGETQRKIEFKEDRMIVQ